MIAVTGATGHLGRLVIVALLKKVPASGIVAAVRNVDKARDLAALGVQVCHADYNQPPGGRCTERRGQSIADLFQRGRAARETTSCRHRRCQAGRRQKSGDRSQEKRDTNLQPIHHKDPKINIEALRQPLRSAV